MKFRTRLVLAATVAVITAIFLSAIAAYLVARNSLLDSLDATLQRTASEIGSLSTPQHVYGYRLQFIDQTGTPDPFCSNLGTLPVSPQTLAVAAGRSRSAFVTVDVGGQELREFVTPAQCQLPSSVSGPFVDTQNGALQLATSLEPVNRQLTRLGIILGLVALIGVALAIVLGWLVGRAALVPLNELTNIVDDVAATTDVSRRLDPGGPDELGRLRRSFNHLLQALEASRQAQQKLVLDASHELRTPITSLRTNLEVARRFGELPEGEQQVLVNDVLSQLDELTKLVTDLAELTRGEHTTQAPTFLRLDQLVEDCVAIAQTHGRPRGVTFDLVAAPCWMLGQPDRLSRAVGNLLDNALKWSPDHGQVEVTCHEGVVSVRDHGPGISEDDLPYIFNRFYRAPAARSLPGSGLGLAIVVQVAQAEGGSVDVANAARRRGGDDAHVPDRHAAGGTRVRAERGPTSLIEAPGPPVSPAGTAGRSIGSFHTILRPALAVIGGPLSPEVHPVCMVVRPEPSIPPHEDHSPLPHGVPGDPPATRPVLLGNEVGDNHRTQPGAALAGGAQATLSSCSLSLPPGHSALTGTVTAASGPSARPAQSSGRNERRHIAMIRREAFRQPTTLAVQPAGELDAAQVLLHDEILAMDKAANGQRFDSEISRLNRSHGRPFRASPLLRELLARTERAALMTRHPGPPRPWRPNLAELVGAEGQGNQSELGDDSRRAAEIIQPPAGQSAWAEGPSPVVMNTADGLVVLPAHLHVDVSELGPALCADRAAARIAALTGAGVLISIGGALSIAGPPPEEGWSVAVRGDESRGARRQECVITLSGGGMATAFGSETGWPSQGATVATMATGRGRPSPTARGGARSPWPPRHALMPAPMRRPPWPGGRAR